MNQQIKQVLYELKQALWHSSVNYFPISWSLNSLVKVGISLFFHILIITLIYVDHYNYRKFKSHFLENS